MRCYSTLLTRIVTFSNGSIALKSRPRSIIWFRSCLIFEFFIRVFIISLCKMVLRFRYEPLVYEFWSELNKNPYILRKSNLNFVRIRDFFDFCNQKSALRTRWFHICIVKAWLWLLMTVGVTFQWTIATLRSEFRLWWRYMVKPEITVKSTRIFCLAPIFC